jgi:hypothetical protein
MSVRITDTNGRVIQERIAGANLERLPGMTRSGARHTTGSKGRWKMNNFIAGIAIAFTIAFVFWIAAFDAIDRHMVEYQECGYPCKVSEHD